MADRGWKRRPDEPIPLPRGRQLLMLEAAGNHITKLPNSVCKCGRHGNSVRREQLQHVSFEYSGVNRIGRLTLICMLLITAPATIWHVLGHYRGRFKGAFSSKRLRTNIRVGATK
jgi:hypothetical protein